MITKIDKKYRHISSYTKMTSHSSVVHKTSIPSWFDAMHEDLTSNLWLGVRTLSQALPGEDPPHKQTEYYKVTYKFIQATHDGYCSSADGIEWNTTVKVGYLPKQQWEFTHDKFKLKGRVTCDYDRIPHHKSGACALWAEVQLENVELITTTV